MHVVGLGAFEGATELAVVVVQGRFVSSEGEMGLGAGEDAAVTAGGGRVVLVADDIGEAFQSTVDVSGVVLFGGHRRIDPTVTEVVQTIAPHLPDPGPAPGVPFRRAALEAVYGLLPAEPCGPVVDIVISSATGTVAARRYAPAALEPQGVVVWLHGGAWLAGSIHSHDAICRILANRSGATVLNVGYRLAPEHRFPAGLDDATAAVEWAWTNRRELGSLDAAPIVAGDSAGATFSAVIALAARDRGDVEVAGQVLVYPATDLRMQSASWDDFGGAEYGLPRAEVAWSIEQYGADLADWRASPLLAERVDGVAPALVITAECDPLRDEAEHYARRLVEAGVPVNLHCYIGMIHGFVGLVGLPASDHALSEIAAFVRNSVRASR